MRVLDQFKANLARWRDAFKQTRTFERPTQALVALLASQGRNTLTHAITFKGTEQSQTPTRLCAGRPPSKGA